MRRLVIALALGVITPERVQAAPLVHIVISGDGFSEHLSRDGAIAAVPAGTLMRISFQYSEYDYRHPYLIAERFCGQNQFIRWGAAPHPSLGEIDLVCARARDETRKMPLIGGH